jgi:hypothetical protein
MLWVAWLGNYVRRLIYYTATLLMAACGSSVESVPEPHALPVPVAIRPLVDSPPAVASRALPELQLARLEYTFEAAELVRRDWPAMQAAQTCVMLVEATLQWVLNCEVAPSGFAQTAQQFRGRPIYVHEAGSFDAGGQARSTAQLLATTPAAAQVPSSGSPNQSLPGAKPWLVVGSLEALALFHPAFTRASTEAWVSVIVHELVHTHQLRAPGSERFGNAIAKLERTPAALTDVYVHTTGYHDAVEREYELLTRAARFSPTDKLAARRALKRWLTLYDQRIAQLQHFPRREQLIADDALFSYLEGVARYVESQFLEDPSLHPAPALSADPRFGNYKLFLGKGYAGSPNRQLDAHYFYAIGYHLCVLIDRLDPSWRSAVHKRKNFLFDVVREVADTAK